MKRFLLILITFFSLQLAMAVEDDLLFKAQLSAFANYTPSNDLDLYSGIRALPQLNYELNFDNLSLLDFEASLNAYGNAGFHLADSSDFDGKIKPYRLWGRYSTEQFECRLGLQKLDFGQAMMLRPLMWFDSVDPRDPLGITDGVYGGLLRYYFLDNTNMWLWGLYGNDAKKGLEIYDTYDDSFEYGGRVQSPVLGGEMALTYHHRTVDAGLYAAGLKSNENRVGFDARWDFLFSAYVEGAWVNSSENMSTLTNQSYLTLGVDYTFGLGGGLYTVVEHMMVGMGQEAFTFDQSVNLTAMQMTYPIGMFDNVGAIVYYDWANNDVYNFINWFRQYDVMTFYLMAYWNPENTLLVMPGMDTSQNMMSGKGAQAMVVFNF